MSHVAIAGRVAGRLLAFQLSRLGTSRGVDPRPTVRRPKGQRAHAAAAFTAAAC